MLVGISLLICLTWVLRSLCDCTRNPIDTPAKCTDGSSPVYYIRKGSGDGAKRWHIHFQGANSDDFYWCIYILVILCLYLSIYMCLKEGGGALIPAVAWKGPSTPHMVRRITIGKVGTLRLAATTTRGIFSKTLHTWARTSHWTPWCSTGTPCLCLIATAAPLQETARLAIKARCYTSADWPSDVAL